MKKRPNEKLSEWIDKYLGLEIDEDALVSYEKTTVLLLIIAIFLELMTNR